jgi:hypothetical protein
VITVNEHPSIMVIIGETFLLFHLLLFLFSCRTRCVTSKRRASIANASTACKGDRSRSSSPPLFPTWILIILLRVAPALVASGPHTRVLVSSYPSLYFVLPRIALTVEKRSSEEMGTVRCICDRLIVNNECKTRAEIEIPGLADNYHNCQFAWSIGIKYLIGIFYISIWYFLMFVLITYCSTLIMKFSILHARCFSLRSSMKRNKSRQVMISASTCMRFFFLSFVDNAETCAKPASSDITFMRCLQNYYYRRKQRQSRELFKFFFCIYSRKQMS